MGMILYMVDKKCISETEYKNMSLKQTLLIGISQALAFIPGVSRSGVTMTTARILGVKRESAAKYSFMLSAPIVLGATIFKIKDFVFNLQFFIGVLVSFIVGIIVIKYLLKYLQKGSFKIFAIYRIIIGIMIILVFTLKNLM
jgi:undecaprenyl-diphosphatase